MRRQRVVVYIGCLIMLMLGAWLLSARFTDRVDSFAKCAAEGYPVTESDPPTCRADNRTFTGPRVTPAPTAEAAESVPFDILVDGDSHGRYPGEQKVIADHTEWQRYWASIHASISPLPPILPVDFATQNVVALSEGQQPTGGYDLKITGIMTSSKGTSVHVTVQIPAAGCMVTQAVTNRYFIVRTKKLTDPVSFLITKDYRKC